MSPPHPSHRTRRTAPALILATALLSVTLLSAGTFALDPLPGHPADACQPPFHVHGAGWDLCWQQDNVRGQGLELNQVHFHDESVLWKIGVPFSITRYEQDIFGPFKDLLGSGGNNNPGFGLGSMQIHPEDCPRILGQGLLLNDRRICVETRDGPEPAIALWARYNIFNYRFLQGYILDSRGVVEPFVSLGGTLIDGSAVGADGANHFHHVYWRVDFDIAAPGNDGFQMFLRPHDDLQLTGRTINQLPQECRQQARAGETGWCTLAHETPLVHQADLMTRWRVQDPVDTNLFGRAKSYEAEVHTHAPPDHNFTTFDALLLQHQGDSTEIGYEVPPLPVAGDAHLAPYHDPPEPVDDPVVWFAVHAYHDTRDEDRPSVSYHHVSFTLGPRNFLAQNPGEDTHHPRPITSIPNPGGPIDA